MCEENKLCRDTAPEIENYINSHCNHPINWNNGLTAAQNSLFQKMISLGLIAIQPAHYYPTPKFIEDSKRSPALRKTLRPD